MTGELDCAFDDGQRTFRFRACAIIVDGGRVLMARNDVEPYHYAVGGGVHHGESAVDAVRREVLEETGLDLEVERLAFIHENFFDGDTTSMFAGRQAHEVAFYFLMRFDPGQQIRTSPGTTAGCVAEWVEWVELAAYGRERPAYPTFLPTELADLGPTPKLITTRE